MFDSSDGLSLPPGDYCLLDTPDARVRLAATTTMASTLAHEVSQPLAAAVNYMQACASRLRRRGEGYDDLLLLLDHASKEALKAGEMIRRMRRFIVTGKVAGGPENLRTMVERVIAALTPIGAAEIEIEREIALSDYVMCDRIQIEQLLSNLLRNACEALRGRKRRRIAIEAVRQGKEVLVRIADNGPGLPKGDSERLFEPGTGTGRGRGLGLAICKAIVEGHGGRIWAEAGAEGGAAIAFTLPAAEPPAKARQG